MIKYNNMGFKTAKDLTNFINYLIMKEKIKLIQIFLNQEKESVEKGFTGFHSNVRISQFTEIINTLEKESKKLKWK
jgi:hypothetical protein